MLNLFRNLSIRWKLIIFVDLTTAVGLLISGAAFVNYEMETYRESVSSNLTTIGQILARTSTAALAFGDVTAATASLSILEREGHIQDAAIYGKNGTTFARYSRGRRPETIPASAPADGLRFEAGAIVLAHPIALDTDRIGTLYLRRDLSDKDARLKRYASMAGLILLAAMLAAVLVSSILRNLISRPILRLAEAAKRVSHENNYEIRVQKFGHDELGTLVDQFNEMLGQIHSRDEALQAAKDELEDRVTARTLQLQAEIAERESIRQDLVAAKEAAEASDKAKSAFLANMSHELRTPLNAIIGYSEIVEEDAAEHLPSVIPDLQRIHRAGKLLLELINDVLDISKIEAGRMQVRLEPLDVGRVIDEVTATVEPLVWRNGNKFIVDCNDRDAVIYADPLKFRQSLLNLLSNAGKFTKEGLVILRVGKTTDADGEWIDWQVKDTGIGIAQDQTGKLFHSFSQVDNSPTRSHRGTGLGLAISKRLCEMMGGTIRVESEPGVGSTFTIRLPNRTSRPQNHQEDQTNAQLLRLGIVPSPPPAGVDSGPIPRLKERRLADRRVAVRREEDRK
jgi:signal transduction histidine kinase